MGAAVTDHGESGPLGLSGPSWYCLCWATAFPGRHIHVYLWFVPYLSKYRRSHYRKWSRVCLWWQLWTGSGLPSLQANKVYIYLHICVWIPIKNLLVQTGRLRGESAFWLAKWLVKTHSLGYPKCVSFSFRVQVTWSENFALCNPVSGYLME